MNTKKCESIEALGLIQTYVRLIRDEQSVNRFISDVNSSISPIGEIKIKYIINNNKDRTVIFGTKEDREISIIVSSLQEIINKWREERKEIERKLPFIDFKEEEYFI